MLVGSAAAGGEAADAYATVHGLYWFTVILAELRPVLLLLDDGALRLVHATSTANGLSQPLVVGELRSILQPYLEGNGPFPEGLHVTVVGGRLVLGQPQTEINWATWAISEVEQWLDTETPHDPDHLLDLLEAAIARRPTGTAETHSDTKYAGES